MRATGQRSPTDRRGAGFCPALGRPRPGSLPGRRFGLGILVGILLGPLLVSSLPAQEILSWWRRDLLPLDLQPGHWVRYQSDELSDGRAFTDTLRFNLRDRDGDLVWLEVDSRNARERTFLLLDPGRIADGAELLDALLRLVRIGPEGQMVEEPIEQHRESRVVQRHFQDAFAEPTLERRALPDTLLSGEPAPREYLALTETREEHSPLGSTVLVLRSELLAEVVVSPRMPLFGVLWARNRTQVTSRTERDGEVLDRGRRSPPLYNELVLRCLDYGTDGPVGIPGALRP